MLISVSLDIGGYRRTLSTRQNWESAIRVGDLTPDQIVEADRGTGPTKVLAKDVPELASLFPPKAKAVETRTDPDTRADLEPDPQNVAASSDLEDNDAAPPPMDMSWRVGGGARPSRGQILLFKPDNSRSTRTESGVTDRPVSRFGPGPAILLAALIIGAALIISRSLPPRHAKEQPAVSRTREPITPVSPLPDQAATQPPARPAPSTVAPPRSAPPPALAPAKPPSQAKPPVDYDKLIAEDSGLAPAKPPTQAKPPPDERQVFKRPREPAPPSTERARPPTPVPPPRPPDLLPAMSIPGRDEVPPGEDAILPTTADAITVRVCDRTNYAMRLAAVYTPRSAPHSFRSVGYWRVEAHTCRDLFQTVNVKFYLHKENIDNGAVVPTSQPGSLRQVCRFRNAPYSRVVPPNNPICPAGLESDEFTYITAGVRTGPTVFYYYE